MIRVYPIPPVLSADEMRTARLQALKGEFPHPFIIAGLAPKTLTDGGIATWQLIISPAQPEDMGVITEADAKRIVKRNNMERAGAYRWGRVYERPDKAFYNQWHGFYGTKQLACVWDLVKRDPGFTTEMNRGEVYAYYEDEDAIVICGPNVVVNFLRARLGGNLYPASEALNNLKIRTIKFKAI